jgi:nucleoside-triphosphatase THEP1
MTSSAIRLRADACRPRSALPPVPPILDDADGDIAALVYSRDARPDVVLCDFATRLGHEGRRVCGLIQLRDRSQTSGDRTLMTLNDQRTLDVPLASSGVDAQRFHIDARWIDRMAIGLEGEIARGTDVIVASRFGPLELAGRGFARTIRLASQTRTPLVIAVPESGFEDWTRASAGMAVRLDCRLDSLLDWWSSLTQTSRRAAWPRVCELVK